MPSQFDAAWKDQNAVASRAVQRRLKAGEKDDGPRGTSNELTRRHSPGVPGVLPQDHNDYALTFFFNSYLLLSLASKPLGGYLDCIYPVWTQSSPESPLRPAITAVAMSLLEAWSWMNPNSPQSLARPHYVRGIAALRRHLQNGGDVDDDILMATLMLDMYDGITSFCGARSHTGVHLIGSAALIEKRQRRPFNGEASHKIISGIRSMIVGRALRNQESVSSDALTRTSNAQNIPRTPQYELEEIQFEVANLLASASALETTPVNRPSLASEILAKAHGLDQRLLDWTAAMPPDWKPTSCDAESVPRTIRDAGLYHDRCDIYPSIFTATTLTSHASSRINLQLTILACLPHLPTRAAHPFLSSAQEQQRTARATVQRLADTICASVPFYLGDRASVLRIDDQTIRYPRVGSGATPVEHYRTAAAYGGMFLMQRLPQLLALPLREGQREWVLGQMGRVKRVYLAREGGF
ncbi:MAG: hypothetical protein HETSPECPRED_005243 [Heterodermia speciosa]|uniref:Uncharacterized protein n=1 Tax=Heterodermia speciosa TaxID=116794 RepID=A0A8H3IJE8_9LECA|nr:MAG: hypothetical protein HETSPECPRED_005243 [Heterodermia speciosa]